MFFDKEVARLAAGVLALDKRTAPKTSTAQIITTALDSRWKSSHSMTTSMARRLTPFLPYNQQRLNGEELASACCVFL